MGETSPRQLVACVLVCVPPGHGHAEESQQHHRHHRQAKPSDGDLSRGELPARPSLAQGTCREHTLRFSSPPPDPCSSARPLLLAYCCCQPPSCCSASPASRTALVAQLLLHTGLLLSAPISPLDADQPGAATWQPGPGAGAGGGAYLVRGRRAINNAARLASAAKQLHAQARRTLQQR